MKTRLGIRPRQADATSNAVALVANTLIGCFRAQSRLGGTDGMEPAIKDRDVDIRPGGCVPIGQSALMERDRAGAAGKTDGREPDIALGLCKPVCRLTVETKAGQGGTAGPLRQLRT